jgi:hypothetical protein
LNPLASSWASVFDTANAKAVARLGVAFASMPTMSNVMVSIAENWAAFVSSREAKGDASSYRSTNARRMRAASLSLV